MTSLLGDMKNLFVTPAEKFIHAVISDIRTWLKDAETTVVADAQIWWGQNKLIIGQYSASQLAILQGLVQTAAADAAAGDYSAIVADVTTQATAKELVWVTELTTAELAAVVAFLAYKPAPATPPAAT